MTKPALKLLTKIERIDSSNQSLYEIECAYDLQGNLIRTKTPAETIDTSYDLLGRALAIQSPHWEATYDRFDPVGNLLQKTLTQVQGIFSQKRTKNRLKLS